MAKKKIDFKALEKVIIAKQVKKLRLMSFDLRKGIIERTLSSKDVNLKDFTEYSKKYGKLKQEQYEISKPNLFGTATSGKNKSSGHMLNDIVFKDIKFGFKFMFNTEKERAKAAGNNKTREFFGLDKNQLKYIKKKLSKL